MTVSGNSTKGYAHLRSAHDPPPLIELGVVLPTRSNIIVA